MSVEQDNEDQIIRDQLNAEPLVFREDGPGQVRFASDILPWRVVIDPALGFIRGPTFHVDHGSGTVTIVAGGRTAVYVRRGVDPHGRWVCNLKRL